MARNSDDRSANGIPVANNLSALALVVAIASAAFSYMQLIDSRAVASPLIVVNEYQLRESNEPNAKFVETRIEVLNDGETANNFNIDHETYLVVEGFRPVPPRIGGY
jgi:hypothetical protein